MICQELNVLDKLFVGILGKEYDWKWSYIFYDIFHHFVVSYSLGNEYWKIIFMNKYAKCVFNISVEENGVVIW